MSTSVSQKTSEIKSSLSAIGEDLYKKHQKPTWGYESLSKNNDSSKLNEGNYSQADKYRNENKKLKREIEQLKEDLNNLENN